MNQIKLLQGKLNKKKENISYLFLKQKTTSILVR